MSPTWTHLVRFQAREDGQIHLGQIDPRLHPDVGLSVVEGKNIQAKLIKGSIYDGIVTDTVMTIDQLLSPIARPEVPLIRCLGLNYRDHAKEANMPIPETPVLFFKPRTALSGPAPAKLIIPRLAQDGSADYEAELTFIISKTGKDISEDKALEYVLGYTCGNDVSARTQQFMNSQWSFSKGFDYSAPIGPVLVSPSAIPRVGSANIKAIHNGNLVQDSNTEEMIFSVANTIAFLSQGTTLEQGTVIMTGTPPGIGCMRNPKINLQHGDDMRVFIAGIGTLVNEIHYA